MAKGEVWLGGTLEQFVEFHVTQKKAAEEIGCREETLNRWLNGHEKPGGMAAAAFRRFRISTVK